MSAKKKPFSKIDIVSPAAIYKAWGYGLLVWLFSPFALILIIALLVCTDTPKGESCAALQGFESWSWRMFIFRTVLAIATICFAMSKAHENE